MKTCSVKGCSNPAHQRGLCGGHYMQWYRYGNYDPAIQAAPARTREGTGTRSFKSGLPCEFEGCDGLMFSRGWCSMHYYRWKKFGDPALTPKPRPRNGKGKGKRINGRYETANRRAYLEKVGTIPRCECPKQESMHVRKDKHGQSVLHSEADQARDLFTKYPNEICTVDGCEISIRLSGSGWGFCKRH